MNNERIDLNSIYARSRAGITERDLIGLDLPIPDYIISMIARLKIPDKCLEEK